MDEVNKTLLERIALVRADVHVRIQEERRKALPLVREIVGRLLEERGLSNTKYRIEWKYPEFKGDINK